MDTSSDTSVAYGMRLRLKTISAYAWGHSGRVTFLAQLRLSRFHHWLPGCEAHPAVVQSTAQCQHEITAPLLPQAHPVFDDATALDTPVHMLAPSAASVEGLGGPCLRQAEILARWWLHGHEGRHAGEGEREEAQSVQPPASRGPGRRRRVSHPLRMAAAAGGLPQRDEREGGMAQPDLWHRGVPVLAAIPCLLCRRVLGADEAPLGPVMGPRGDPGTPAGWRPRVSPPPPAA